MFVSSLGRTRRDALGRLPRSLSRKALQLYDSPTKARAPEGHPSLSGATARNGLPPHCPSASPAVSVTAWQTWFAVRSPVRTCAPQAGCLPCAQRPTRDTGVQDQVSGQFCRWTGTNLPGE